MPKAGFMTVWNRIATHEGGEFHTATALPFTYTIDGDALVTTRTSYKLTRANFEAAYADVPISNPGLITKTIRGSSYVWAILHDDRIRCGEW